MLNKVKWCFSIKNGLELVKPNEGVSQAYLREALDSLRRAERNFEEEDLLWSTVVIYYAEYYAIYSFLQKIGVKCENHLCSILAARYLLGDFVKVVENHRTKRIGAQYYIEVGKKEEISAMIKEAKWFITKINNITRRLDNNKIKKFRITLHDAA